MIYASLYCLSILREVYGVNIALMVFLAMVGAGETLHLTLHDVVQYALKNNKDILIEEKNVEISKNKITTQWGEFDPVFQITSSYTDAEDPTASTFIPSGAVSSKVFDLSLGLNGNLPTGTFYDLFNFEATRTRTNSPIEALSPYWQTSLSFTVGQELLRNFGMDVNMAQITVAKRSKDISVKELERVISDTLVKTESAYWELVAAYKFLDLAKTALDLALDLQRRNEIQVKVGVLPPVTVTQAKSEVAARQVDLIQAENLLKQREDSLKNLLSIPLDTTLVPVDEPTTVLKPVDEKEAEETALKKRPELAQAELNIKNKDTLKRFWWNQRLPRLAVQGSVTLKGLGGEANPNRVSFGPDPSPQPISGRFDSAGDAFSQIGNGDFATWQVLGVLSIPLFNYTAKGEYRSSVAELHRSALEYERLVDSVNLDVKNAVREVQNSLRRIDAANISVKLAEEVLHNEEEKLRVGIGTTRDVLEAQRDLVRERFAQIRAIADYNIALAQLERAKGTLIEARHVNIKNDVGDGGI